MEPATGLAALALTSTQVGVYVDAVNNGGSIVNEELTRFVREALSRGAGRDEIEEALGDAGWRQSDIDKALSAWVDREFVAPIPRPRPYMGAREAFLYLVLFAALYTAAISFGNVAFVLINRAFADVAFTPPAAASAEMLRWGLAYLVISFPAFLLVQRLVRRVLRSDPELRSSRIRKWLTYMTLFLAAGVLAGDLIALVFFALGGELAVRFVLKAAIVAAIAGSVFGYYFWDLRQDESEPAEDGDGSRLPATFATVSSVAVAAAVVLGLVAVGSPGSARDRGLDVERISNLRDIVRGVDVYWERNGALPESLDALSAERDITVLSIFDPEGRAPYAYRTTDQKTYTLCATFSRDAPTDQASLRTYPYRERFWRHPAGYHCFDLEAIEPDARRW